MKEVVLKIQSGILKGMKVPIPTSIKGNSNFTSSILKKSIFSILNSLELNSGFSKDKSIFIDLFSGSSQMGVEAFSQGFHKIIFFEIDSIRFRGINSFLKTTKLNYTCFHKDAFRFHSSFEKEDVESLIYFVDPPYMFWEKDTNKIEKLLLELIESNNNLNVFILVQAPKEIELKNFNERILGNQKVFINF